MLALASLPSPSGPRVLDAMSGTGVRALRYAAEANASFVHANDRMHGEHPLPSNLSPLVESGVARVSGGDAVDLYLSAKLEGSRFDLIDADAFGTGQPHASEAWWAVRSGGLLYLCATDSLTTKGANPHQALAGYAAVAQPLPACNEAGLRMLAGASFREAAARHLHARPAFCFFHKPSSTFRVMMRLVRAKRPPATFYSNLAYVARCPTCGEIWRVEGQRLGEGGSSRPCDHVSTPPVISGPMWVGPMHEEELITQMRRGAAARGWGDTEEVLAIMQQEAITEARGALLFYHLGEVQRALSIENLPFPRMHKLLSLLQEAGYGASRSHSEPKALKTSATLADVVRVVAAYCKSTQFEEAVGGDAET